MQDYLHKKRHTSLKFMESASSIYHTKSRCLRLLNLLPDPNNLDLNSLPDLSRLVKILLNPLLTRQRLFGLQLLYIYHVAMPSGR